MTLAVVIIIIIRTEVCSQRVSTDIMRGVRTETRAVLFLLRQRRTLLIAAIVVVLQLAGETEA
jgi:hypothetical protein